MIILFTNHTYGQQFAQAFLDYCLQHRVPARMVFSVFYGDQHKHAEADTFIQKLKFTLAESDSIQIEKAEVNSEAFLSSLALGTEQLHGIVAGFNQIFKAPLLNRFHSLVNIHPSLLPFYRGPVPSYWAIERGERFSGFSFVSVSPEIDKGELIYQQVVEIEPGESPMQLDQKIAAYALPVMCAYLKHLTSGEDFCRQKIDARAYVCNPVDYLSFPDKDRR